MRFTETFSFFRLKTQHILIQTKAFSNSLMQQSIHYYSNIFIVQTAVQLEPTYDCKYYANIQY